jgi:hypothetical protein
MTDLPGDRGGDQIPPVGAGHHSPGALDEVTGPRTDLVREAKDRDLDDPAHVDIDPETWRNGGPTRSGGLLTTTGGTAGPASVRRQRNDDSGRKVAPTTTGDATSGGMNTPAGGSTSDNTTGAASVGAFSDPGTPPVGATGPHGPQRLEDQYSREIRLEAGDATHEAQQVHGDTTAPHVVDDAGRPTADPPPKPSGA